MCMYAALLHSDRPRSNSIAVRILAPQLSLNSISDYKDPAFSMLWKSGKLKVGPGKIIDKLQPFYFTQKARMLRKKRGPQPKTTTTDLRQDNWSKKNNVCHGLKPNTYTSVTTLQKVTGYLLSLEEIQLPAHYSENWWNNQGFLLLFLHELMNWFEEAVLLWNVNKCRWNDRIRKSPSCNP